MLGTGSKLNSVTSSINPNIRAPPFTAVTLAPTVNPSYVFTLTTVQLTFQPSSIVPAGSIIQITFPPFFPEFNIQYVDVASLGISPVQNTQAGATFSYSAVTSVLTITGAFPAGGLPSGTQVQLNIAGIFLPATTSAVTNIRVALATADNKRFNRNDAVSLKATLPVATTDNQASLSTAVVGATSRIIYTFTVPGPIGAGYVLAVSSTNFGLGSCSIITSVGATSPDCNSVTFTSSQNKLATITVVLNNPVNNNIAVPGSVGLTIKDTLGQAAYTSETKNFNFTLQTMTNLVVAAVTPNLGVDSPVRVQFTSTMPLPANTKLLVRLPATLPLKGALSCTLDGVSQTCSVIDTSTIQLSIPAAKGAGSQVIVILNTVSLPICDNVVSAVSVEAQLVEQSQVNLGALTPSAMGSTLVQTSFNVLSTDTLKLTITTPASIRMNSVISIQLPPELVGQESAPCSLSGASPTAACSSPAQGKFVVSSVAPSADIPSNTALTLNLGPLTNPRVTGTYNIVVSVESAAPASCTYGSSNFGVSVTTAANFPTINLEPSLRTLSSFHALKLTYTVPSSVGTSNAVAQILPTDTFGVVLPAGSLASSNGSGLSLSAGLTSLNFMYLMSPVTASSTSYTVEQKDQQGRVIRRGTAAVSYTGIATMQATMIYLTRSLMGQPSNQNLTITSPSFLEKGQQIKVSRSASSFGITGPVLASIANASVPVSISGQDIFITLPSSIDPNTAFTISLDSPNPTVSTLDPDQLTISILTPTNSTTASTSPLSSRLSFLCEPTCTACTFLSTNCTACIQNHVLKAAVCVFSADAGTFPVWLYPVFLLAVISAVLMLVLFRYPLNGLHAVWSVLAAVQMVYCLLVWGLVYGGVVQGAYKYPAAVWVFFVWGLVATGVAGVLGARKIKKLANWREKLSWACGISVSRLGVTSRRRKQKGTTGWRLDANDTDADFEYWKKIVNLFGLGTYLAIYIPFSLGGIILWTTGQAYPFAVEAAIFPPLLGLTLLGSWWELRKVEIKPEHQALNNTSKISQGTKIQGIHDDSAASLNPLVKNIHLDFPDHLIESSKETQRIRGTEDGGVGSKTASRKGIRGNDKDSLIYIDDGHQVSSSQHRSFVFDPENPTATNPSKPRYKEVHNLEQGSKEQEKNSKSTSITPNQIQLVKDAHKSQDSEEIKDRVGPLPPQKDYKIPLSSRLDTGREDSQRTSRKDPYLLDHSPGSELHRRALESELNGISTPSGQYSSLKPQSDRYPYSISNRGHYSAGNEAGNSLSSDRMLRAVAAHLQNLPSARERFERSQPLAATPASKFPTFPKLELDKLQQVRLSDEVPDKATATKVAVLSDRGDSQLSREHPEYISRPGKVPVSGRRKLDKANLPKNHQHTEVKVDVLHPKKLIESAPLVSVASKPVTPLQVLNLKKAEPSRFRENRLRERLGPEQKRYLEIVYEQEEGDPEEIIRENPMYDEPQLDKQIQMMERAKIGAPPDPSVVEMSKGRRSLSQLMYERPDLRLDLAKVKALDKGSIIFDETTGVALLENSGERVDHERVHKILGTDPRLLIRPDDTPETLRTRQKLLNAGIRIEAINSIPPAEVEKVAERTMAIQKPKLKSGAGSPKDGPGTHRSGKPNQIVQNGSMKIAPLSARKGYHIDDPETYLQDADGEDSEPEDLGPYGPAQPSQELLRSSQELLRKDLASQLKNGKASAKDIAEKAHEFGLGGKLAQLRVAIHPEDMVETSERLELKAINGQSLESFVRRDLKFKDPATLPLRDQQPELLARGIYLDSQGRMLPVGDQPMEDVSRGLFRDPKGVPRKIITLKAEDLAKGIWMDPETQKPQFVNGQPAASLASLLLLDRKGQKTNLRKQNKSDIAKGVLVTENGTKVDLGVPQSRQMLDKGEFKWKDGLIYRWIDQTPAELSLNVVRGMGRADQPSGGYDISKPIQEVQSVWPALDPQNKTNQNSHASMNSNGSGVGGLSANEIRARKKEFYDNDPYESKKKPSEALVFPEDTDSYLVPTSAPYNPGTTGNRGITSRNPLNASKSTVYNSMQNSTRALGNQPIIDTLLINLVADNNESFDLSVRIEETADDAPEEVVGIEMSRPDLSTGIGFKNGPFNSSSTTSRIDSRLNQQQGPGMKYGRLPDLDVAPKPKGITGFDSNSLGNVRIDKEPELPGRSSLGDLKPKKQDNQALKSNRAKLSPLIDIDTGSPRIGPLSIGPPMKKSSSGGQGTSMPGTSTAAKRNNLIAEAMQTMPFPANSAKQLGPIKKPSKVLPGAYIKQAYDSSPKYTPTAPVQPPVNNKLQTTGHSDFLKKNYVDKLEREVERIKSRGHQLHKYNVGKGSLDRLDRTNGPQNMTVTQKGSRDA